MEEEEKEEKEENEEWKYGVVGEKEMGEEEDRQGGKARGCEEQAAEGRMNSGFTLFLSSSANVEWTMK